MAERQKGVVAAMLEREPDFEDEKIRLWKTDKDAPDRPPTEDDPTVLPVDMEKEEIFESRIYPALMHPTTVLYVAENVANLEEPPSLVEFFEKMRETMEDTCMKVLSKRNKEDGRINYIVIVVGGSVRGLVERGELPDEQSYRTMVAELEEAFVVKGIVGEPSVTTPEEWRRYEQEQSLPGDETGPVGPL